MNSSNKFLIALGILTLSATFSFAQTSTKDDEFKGWHLKDKTADGFYGISIQQAYEMVKNKKSSTVIVAVIDSGIDTLHEVSQTHPLA
ncbi:MAG: hypothetical protein QM725_04565 [Lacibacter sp.]